MHFTFTCMSTLSESQIPISRLSFEAQILQSRLKFRPSAQIPAHTQDLDLHTLGKFLLLPFLFLLLFLILLHTSTLYEAQINALKRKPQITVLNPSLKASIQASWLLSQPQGSNPSFWVQISVLKFKSSFEDLIPKFDLKAQIPISMLLWLIS